MEEHKWKMFVPVDINLFVTSFTMSIIATCNTNLNLQRICYTILERDRTHCELLGNANNNETQKLEADVQYINNQIDLVRQCTEAVITLFISLLIGPWTDRFGRKPGLVLVMTGILLTSCLGTLYAGVEMSPWYILVIGIPAMMTGGVYSFITICMAYMTDVTSLENRGIMMAILQAMMAVGDICGTFLSTPLLKALDYFKLNLVTTVVIGIFWLYTIFGIKESLEKVEHKGMWKGFFDLSNPKQMFITTFKKRKGANRTILLLVGIVFAMVTFISVGENRLKTLFLRRKFGWTMAKYTVYNGVSSLITILGTVLGTLLFTKLFRMRESTVCFITYILTLTGTLLRGFAIYDWQIYLVPIITCLDGTHGPFITTMISRLVTQDEIGKVLSGINGLRFFGTLISSPMYTEIYNETLKTDPATYNYLTAALYVIVITILITIITLERRHSNTDGNAKPSISGKEHQAQKTSIKQIINELSTDIVLNSEPRFSLVHP